MAQSASDVKSEPETALVSPEVTVGVGVDGVTDVEDVVVVVLETFFAWDEVIVLVVGVEVVAVNAVFFLFDCGFLSSSSAFDSALVLETAVEEEEEIPPLPPTTPPE